MDLPVYAAARWNFEGRKARQYVQTQLLPRTKRAIQPGRQMDRFSRQFRRQRAGLCCGSSKDCEQTNVRTQTQLLLTQRSQGNPGPLSLTPNFSWVGTHLMAFFNRFNGLRLRALRSSARPKASST